MSDLSDEAAKLFAAVSDRFGHQGPECRVCPICQLLSAVNPEVVEHLTAAGLELMLAFRAAGPARRREHAPVERIDIG